MSDVVGARELVAGLADEARAKGIAKLSYHAENCSVTLELGPAPLPPATPARELTPKQKAEAEKREAVTAKRKRLRTMLGRDPTDEELAEL